MSGPITRAGCACIPGGRREAEERVLVERRRQVDKAAEERAAARREAERAVGRRCRLDHSLTLA